MKKYKTIHSIQFLTDRVIVDYGNQQVFQFCKACKDGKHLKAFLNYFGLNMNLDVLGEDWAIRFERRFYFVLSRGVVRRMVTHEAGTLTEYLKKRRERMMGRKTTSHPKPNLFATPLPAQQSPANAYKSPAQK